MTSYFIRTPIKKKKTFIIYSRHRMAARLGLVYGHLSLSLSQRLLSNLNHQRGDVDGESVITRQEPRARSGGRETYSSFLFFFIVVISHPIFYFALLRDPIGMREDSKRICFSCTRPTAYAHSARVVGGRDSGAVA